MLAGLIVLVVVTVTAGAPRLASAGSLKRKSIGGVTLVMGNGVKVGKHNIQPGGQSGYNPKASLYPLYPGDVLRATNDATAQYYVQIGKARAFCETDPTDGQVQVYPSKRVLLNFKSGTSLCGTLPTAQGLMQLGKYGTVEAGGDPVFQVVVSNGHSTIKVQRGVVVVTAKGGARRAVVVGRNLGTTVAAGSEPAAPDKTRPPTGSERRALNQIERSLPPVHDTTLPTVTVAGPPDSSSIRSAKFSFEASEANVTFSCALDGTDFRFCEVPWTYNHLAPGAHTFRVRATDSAGNTGPVARLDWTIDRSKIVFESTRDGVYQIYSMNTDGTDVTNLSRSAANDKDPAWSPDGSKIVFQSDRDPGGDTNLYVMNADGSRQTRLTTGRFNANPSWSPDGRKIVFESTRTGRSEIYVMNADGSGQTQITDDPITTDAAWSPDGSRIAFASTLSGNYQIYTVNPDGSNRFRVTNSVYAELGPAWSPDGKRLAFYSNRDLVGSRIYTVNRDGTGVTRITDLASATPTGDSNPTWAPDSHEIAIQRFAGGANGLYLVSADDGSPLGRLTDTDGLVPDWSVALPRAG